MTKIELLKIEYVILAHRLNDLPPADLRGLPWVQRREKLRAIFKASGIRPPMRHEVRV